LAPDETADIKTKFLGAVGALRYYEYTKNNPYLKYQLF
jgi:hypothetical protein